MWAVTIIGAPKKAAAQAVEDLETMRAVGMAARLA
jgi:anthranilate/para-aminobenzoate synthase component I